VPLHKKMNMTAPVINVSTNVPGSPSWPTTVTTKRDSYSSHGSYMQSVPAHIIDNTKKSPSTSVSKGRKNMKNLQLVVPPVRSSISAPSSPQSSQISGTHTHNRRPSTPICVYQNKPSEHSTNPEADPMALISRTENEIDEESPYKEGPICILPNLYLGTEINAANRPMLQRMNIEYILNVGKEVVVPYMDEITGYTSVYTTRDIKTYTDQLSPGLSISSSVSSEHSFQTATSSPVAQSPNFDSSMPSSPAFTLARSDSFKRSSLAASRPQSTSFQIAQKALTSGNVLTVPATREFRQLKYKKFFWTHNQENLISDFQSAFAFIDEARSAGRNILVHCQCGVSRSASLIVGYVMKANCMTLNQAYEFVKDRSSYISPNMSLVYQLVDFEKTLKLNGNNNNTVSSGSPASKSGAESVKTHSRSSSIESDLLLKSHRRSASLPRSNSGIGASASNGIDSPPRTPGPSDSLSCTNQQQATIKGEPGRFHVITASISTLPISPSVSTPSTASPTSNSLSPTSSTSSPTTPTTLDSTNSSSRTSRSSKLASPAKASQSLLSTNSHQNLQPRSPSRSDRTPLSALNTPLSPTFSTKKQSISLNSSPISLALPEFDLPNTNISLLSYPSRISTIIPSHSKGNGVGNGGQNPGFFTLDDIFSPTRTASPIKSPSFSDLWGEGD